VSKNTSALVVARLAINDLEKEIALLRKALKDLADPMVQWNHAEKSYMCVHCGRTSAFEDAILHVERCEVAQALEVLKGE
jgi:hypothetical protein